MTLLINSMVSKPVTPVTLGANDETFRYLSNIVIVFRSNKYLVTIKFCSTIGPRESGVDSRFPLIPQPNTMIQKINSVVETVPKMSL